MYKYHKTRQLFFSCKLFDTLFLVEFANEQLAVLFSYDETVESLHDDFLFGKRVNDAIVRVEKTDVVSNDTIAVEVVTVLSKQSPPCSKIAPSEVGGTNEYLLGFLHDGIVDGNTFTFGEAPVDFVLFLIGAVDGQHSLENVAHCRLIDAESVDDGCYTPEKYACIPEVRLVL